MSSNVGEVMSKLDWYQKTFTAIKRDDTLTEGGRIRQFNNLAESYRLYGDTVFNTFATAWRDIRGEFKSVARERRSASQRAEDGWSYERLNYYKEQARADINKSENLQELEKLLTRIMDSGSKEQRRAYLECTSTVLSKYHGTVGAGSFIARMEREAAMLTRPPEFDKLDERENELRLQAMRLRDKTQAAANMHPESGVGNLLRLVHIGMNADSTSGNYYYTVEFEPEPVSA